MQLHRSVLNEMFYSIIMFPMLRFNQSIQGQCWNHFNNLHCFRLAASSEEKNERKLGNKTTNYQVHHQLLPQHLLFGVSLAGENSQLI